jgi:RNA polymerase sigma-70 factor (ECF subfamily)
MLEPAASLQFDTWRQLLDWLPRASEAQLLTVFVWAGDQGQVPAAERFQLEEVRRIAFEELVKRTQERLLRYFIGRHGLRDRHLADDLVQETLLQVYTRAELFDPERSFWGWLLRIAHNKLVDHLRRQRVRVVGSGQTEEDLEQQLQKLAVTTVTPDASLLQQERQERLAQLVARLPGLQRRIMELKLAGVKGIDIAQQVQRSPGFVSQAFHEALEVLQDQLGE